MKSIFSKRIYLDHAAATALDEHVARVMIDAQRKFFANPSAIHSAGVLARNVIEESRAKIADAIFAHPNEIIFTGSGTESDALAICGIINNYELIIKNENSQKYIIPHIVTTTIEHPAILENCRMLEKQGRATVTYVDCDEHGIVSPKAIKSAIQEDTILVSVMYANNEIGTIQPIAEIAKEIRHFRKSHVSILSKQVSVFTSDVSIGLPLFHTDAAQAINYLPISNIEKLGVDLLSFNSSKIYGPKGVGVLYKKRGVSLSPLYGGGGQEYGIRSGTEDIVSIVGVSKALERTFAIQEKESTRLVALRDYVIDTLEALSVVSSYNIKLNGDRKNRLPNNINISINGISSELLVIELDARGIEVSAKSACKADDPDESYVIVALRNASGDVLQPTDGSLRISMGRSTTRSDMDAFLKALEQIFEKYRTWKNA